MLDTFFGPCWHCRLLPVAQPAVTTSDVAVPGGELRRPNAPPQLRNPGPQQVAEEQIRELSLSAVGPDGDPTRLLVSGLPEGASFEPLTQRLRFTPDFIQGCRT